MSIPALPLKNVFFNIRAGRTMLGRVEFKLFDDVVPKTAANFRHLAVGDIKGPAGALSYKGAPFHRVIRGFMIQGGDIVNGNGSGSISIYGRQFNDENFTLKHDRPYLLSMANAGRNTNGSQFFVTCVPTPHLNGNHTVFGEVVSGQKIIDAVEEARTDGRDRPLLDIIIDDCGLVEVEAAPQA